MCTINLNKLHALFCSRRLKPILKEKSSFAKSGFQNQTLLCCRKCSVLFSRKPNYFKLKERKASLSWRFISHIAVFITVEERERVAL